MQNKNREAPFFYRKEEIEGEDRPLEASEATFQRHCSPGCVSVCLCVCVSVGVCVGRVRKSALTTTTTTTITTLVWRLWRLVDALNGHGGKNCGRRAVSFQTQDWSLGGGSRWRLLRRSLSLSLETTPRGVLGARLLRRRSVHAQRLSPPLRHHKGRHRCHTAALFGHYLRHNNGHHHRFNNRRAGLPTATRNSSLLSFFFSRPDEKKEVRHCHVRLLNERRPSVFF